VSTLDLPDIQRELPEHAIAIRWVGVRGLRYPASIAFEGVRQHTVATWSIAVPLPPNERGTHMSRFVEAVAERDLTLSGASLANLAEGVAVRLASPGARVSAAFPFFLERRAPVSDAAALVEYEGRLTATATPGRQAEIILGARVPVTSLCPCSKEISDYGAHSQRGYVDIEVRPVAPDINLVDLVVASEAAASAPIFALLKRVDERAVTMGAYDRPAFVEDLARGVAAHLAADPRVGAYSVDVENDESIHNHAAWATIERER
jgi:GTP cyclohydrolase FolE2